MIEHRRCDFAVIGSGFAGSIASMILGKLGVSVVMIERGLHPRFVIGESSTPIANLMLERIADRFELPELAPFSKWGTWRETHPEIGCGLKRGFSFFAHRPGERFSTDASHVNQLLVAASPNDRIADTHWYRPDFDAHLVRLAVDRGVEFHDRTEVIGVDVDGTVKLRLSSGGREHRIEAGFVIDAGGAGGCLGKFLSLPCEPLTYLPETFVVYGHFRGVKRMDDGAEFGSFAGAPYPPDDAAVHHLIDGGWIWVLRFANGITSAGAMLERERWGDRAGEDPAMLWRDVLNLHPSVAELFIGAEVVEPIRIQHSVAFRCAEAHGANWALLPSAAGFVDPMLSSGFALTLLGIWRLADAVESSGFPPPDFSTRTLEELRFVERIVAALYRSMPHFNLFIAVSKLYFAAASFSETRIRLGQIGLGSYGFLMHDTEEFGDLVHRVLEEILAAPAIDHSFAYETISKIEKIIEPIDIAGLNDRSRGRWFPAEADDLFANTSKLGVDRAAIETMLQRCGVEA